MLIESRTPRCRRCRPRVPRRPSATFTVGRTPSPPSPTALWACSYPPRRRMAVTAQAVSAAAARPIANAKAARPANLKRRSATPTHVAHSGNRSGLIAIAPTIKIVFRVKTPKAAMTPAAPINTRYRGTALAYCLEASASSVHARGPPLHAGISPGRGGASGRPASRRMSEISSSATPSAVSFGSNLSTALGSTSAVISTRPFVVSPTRTTCATPVSLPSRADRSVSDSLGA